MVEECAEAERLLAALRVVVAAATLEDKAVWRREGFRSAAAWMASKTGTAGRPGHRQPGDGRRLRTLPALAEAFRAGRLSEAQAREIAEVASEVPDADEQLRRGGREADAAEPSGGMPAGRGRGVDRRRRSVSPGAPSSAASGLGRPARGGAPERGHDP